MPSSLKALLSCLTQQKSNFLVYISIFNIMLCEDILAYIYIFIYKYIRENY
ncbi:uncharacterized protein NEPG_00660 [Nematocida parisii ERTm1]|uniref:Uncharacterized protein n=1 Tax=Nematocida parisii (strain ERTm3) TaxID=935791 RepID=I3EKQ5_NEMP3|nr:uncharacterized protein NEPG_00660 [Nematocida parisii ERTm1]EIJ89802.1 hypothetical protein NEQG_00572 [Nematocida parisii ERTm3]EIJ93995.1 hypothetical protein NEPG_00660 [Nematocida parisii ERTm1]|eukprot:XP_013058491.1 hypothetical protein NEPG_00660 [Nematocida parisii ERTm1]